MRSLKECDKIIKEKFLTADSIYSLAREKNSLNGIEKTINAAIFLFTPFIRGVKTMNALSDLGIYYLVQEGNKQLIVRVAKTDKENLIEEKNISGEFLGDTYIMGDDRFKKVRLIQERK